MLSQSVLFNILVAACALGVLALLFRPHLFTSDKWRATVTPLASIIGSGFLVVAPLLHHIVNGYAAVAMLVVVALSYAIGYVLRYNIRHVEPILDSRGGHRTLFFTEQVANLALAVAYLISVAFYLRLMASFLLQAIGVEDDFSANVITTAFLLFILSAGIMRGLAGLERLEEFAVNIKLSIIVSLLIGLLVYDFEWIREGAEGLMFEKPHDVWQTLRLLGGILLIVQGFETSRYIGDEYDADTRILTMRWAQLLAGLIYIVFVSLALPALIGFDRQPSETAIIALSERVAVVLPFMLILAAVMSQFSASVADTVGAGGLMEEATRQKIKTRVGYAIVSLIAILLVWSIDIFHIIALASRAFAFYYALQCASAVLATLKSDADVPYRVLRISGFVLLGLLMLAVTLFALPAGH